jgi:Tfp pilus assembly protein PilF
LQRGDRASARQYREGVTRDHPDFPSAHNLLSEVYVSMGEAARADEQRRLSGGTGEWREADDPWLSRIYAWSFDPYRLENLGGARLQTQQLDAAATFYEKAVRLAPSDGPTGDALGNFYLQLNALDKAAAVLEAALAAAPPSAALFSTLAQVLRTQGHVTKAIAVLQRGILALPTQSGLRYDLGALLEANNRREEAIAAYREAVRLNPDFPEAHWNLGLCLLAEGQESEAEENLGRALVLRPRNADALVALAPKGLDSRQLGQTACCIRALVEFGTGVPVRQLIERALAAARQAGDSKLTRDFEQLLARAPQ